MECVRSDFEKSQVTKPTEPDKNNEDVDPDLDLLPEYCHYQDVIICASRPQFLYSFFLRLYP
jgi:hypothetical protein